MGFATEWLDSYDKDIDLKQEKIVKFFPDANDSQVCEMIDSGTYQPLNNYLIKNIEYLIDDNVLCKFLIRYLPNPIVYQKIIQHPILTRADEIITFINNGGFNCLNYKNNHSFLDYQKYRKAAETTLLNMIKQNKTSLDKIIPVLLESYCYELDTTLQYLLSNCKISPDITTLQTAYRLNLTGCIEMVEKIGIIPDQCCIGYMIHHNYSNPDIISTIKLYNIIVDTSTVYNNITTADWSPLLCYLYSQLAPCMYDLRRLARCWEQPNAIKYLLSLGIKPDIDCLISSIQFGMGSAANLLLNSCDTQTITQNHKIIYDLLEKCAGSQDIDLFGTIQTLINRQYPISKQLIKLLEHHQHDYPNSSLVMDDCEEYTTHPSRGCSI
jgi:hypothetical protein